MPPDTQTPRKITAFQGWGGLTAVLGKGIPYKLTEGGKARRGLYALMNSRKH